MAQEMPDGSKVQVEHYSQISFAADINHPLDNKSADCMGRSHISADGALLSGSGTCTSFDADGNTASFWWRIDKIDTPDCAGACGAWGYYAGTGKFRGIKGSGTFHRDTMFPNGSSGAWKGEATVNQQGPVVRTQGARRRCAGPFSWRPQTSHSFT